MLRSSEVKLESKILITTHETFCLVPVWVERFQERCVVPEKRQGELSTARACLVSYFAFCGFLLCSFCSCDFLNVVVFFKTSIFNSAPPLFSFPSLLLCPPAKQGCVPLFILHFLNSPFCDMKFFKCTFYSFKKVL